MLHRAFESKEKKCLDERRNKRDRKNGGERKRVENERVKVERIAKKYVIYKSNNILS